MERVLMRARLILCVTLISAIVLSACDGPGIVGPRTVRLARSGDAASTTLAVVGNWRRAVFFLDDFNFSNSSETTFQFSGDGSVVRTQVTRNLTLGLADSVVSTGRWTITGTQLVIDFVTPSSFQLVLQAGVVGDELTLSGETFLRVVN
jgi:hypothetical protein